MTKSIKNKDAFTLIEVMVAVMIISVVILALIQMYANNTHLFISLKKQTKTNQYSSFLIGNEKYGFDDKSISMDVLVDDFDLRDDLRRKLKNIKLKVLYKEIERKEIDSMDLSESELEDMQSTQSPAMVLEVGKSILQTDIFSSSLTRFRIQ